MSSRMKAGGDEAVSVLRGAFDLGYPCDERSSRKMQQILSRRSEGSILRKRSSLMGRRSPHDFQSAQSATTEQSASPIWTKSTIQGGVGPWSARLAPWRGPQGSAMSFGVPFFVDSPRQESPMHPVRLPPVQEVLKAPPEKAGVPVTCPACKCQMTVPHQAGAVRPQAPPVVYQQPPAFPQQPPVVYQQPPSVPQRPPVVYQQPPAIPQPSSYCRNCGRVVAPNAVMCVSCGVAPLNSTNYCPNCGTQTNHAQVVCVRCGIALGNTSGAKTTGKAIFLGLNATDSSSLSCCWGSSFRSPGFPGWSRPAKEGPSRATFTR